MAHGDKRVALVVPYTEDQPQFGEELFALRRGLVTRVESEGPDGEGGTVVTLAGTAEHVEEAVRRWADGNQQLYETAMSTVMDDL